MSFSTAYLLNVALHAAILSVFASLVLLPMRQARHRSIAAIAGLLAVGFLPWLTALRPEPAMKPAAEIESQAPTLLPSWTVKTVSISPISAPDTKPFQTPAKHVSVNPLVSSVPIWAIGTVIGMALLALALLRARAWEKSLVRLDDVDWRTLDRLIPGIPARCHFRISESITSPCVTGFRRPKIVLPRFLFAAGSENGLRWAARHELAHWQAGDSRWIIIFALIRRVNWWNPLVHYLVARWAEAREQLCDLHATGVPDTRTDYGEFLIAMARRIVKQPPLTVAMAKRRRANPLKLRIASLLHAEAGSEKPVGKYAMGICPVPFVAFAALVSCVKISTPERVESETPIVKASIAAGDEGLKTSGFTQYKTSGKFLVRTKKLSLDGTPIILEDAAMNLIMRGAAQEKGCSLMTMPSVTQREGYRAAVEIIRTKPDKEVKQDGETTGPFVGIVLNYTINRKGEQVRVKLNGGYHYVPGEFQPVSDMNETPVREIDWDRLKTLELEVLARITPGQWLCMDFGEIEPGRHLQLFTRVERIDTTGKPLPAYQHFRVIPSEMRPLPESDPFESPQDPPVKSGKVKS